MAGPGAEDVQRGEAGVGDRGAALADVVRAQAAAAGGRPWAESARGGRVVSRAELADVARAWRGTGLAGARLALVVRDPVAFAVLFVSLVAAGATVVPLDPGAPLEANAALLRTAGTTAAVTTDDADDALGGVHELVGEGATVLADARTLRPARVPRGLGDDGDGRGRGASLLFSSGSTGARKAMRLPEAQLLHVARAVARAHELAPGDRAFNPLPLFHVNAEVVALLGTLVSGGAVVLDDRFHRTGFWPLLVERRATWVNAVPAIIAILAQEAPPADVAEALRARLAFVRSASAPLPLPVLERFEATVGIDVVETYGMTEGASQITANPRRERRPGTVGRPVDVELRVVDEAGATSPTGEPGRVQLRGPGIITAYEGGVGADRFNADGWLDTGDLGSLDADGYLTLAGRSDDIINRGGEKIFPREVEDVLREHGAVAEAVVVGRPHPVLGHVPVAYVIATGGSDASGAAGAALEEELAARCARALARSHRPVEVHVVPDLPLGPTGKLSRRLVADRFASAADA